MTLSKRLRDEVCKRLDIKSRQLLRRISIVAIEEGIADRDVALLYLAHNSQIDVNKPRFAIPKDKIIALKEHLKAKSLGQLPVIVTSPKPKQSSSIKLRHLLNFQGKYPEIFYNRLEYEINTAYSNPMLPNAVLMLSRKLIENLVYNLLEYKFNGPQIDLYYDRKYRRAHDFSVLLHNLAENKSFFEPDQHDPIDKFLSFAYPFRLDANSKAHRVMEYLEKMSDIKKLKIPEMTQILLKLIDRVKIQGKP